MIRQHRLQLFSKHTTSVGPGFARSMVAVLVCLAVFVPGASRSESTDFEIFDTVPLIENAISVHSARIGEPRWTVGTFLQYESIPFEVVVGPNAQAPPEPPVDARAQLRLLASRSFAPWFMAGVEMPFTVYEDRPGIGGGKSGTHDLRLRTRTSFVQTDLFAAGLQADFVFPTGDSARLMGSRGIAIQPLGMLLAELSGDTWFARINAGYEMRQETRMIDLTAQVSDRVHYRGSAGYEVIDDRFSLFAEYTGRLQLESFNGGSENLDELYVGLQFRHEAFAITAGGGLGAQGSFGVPQWRGILGFHYQPRGGGGVAGAGALGRTVMTVFDENGRPATGATVTAWQEGAFVSRYLADENGQVAVLGAPGKLTATVSGAGLEDQLITLRMTDKPSEKKIELDFAGKPDPYEECDSDDLNCRLRIWSELSEDRLVPQGPSACAADEPDCAKPEDDAQ